jgi:hypothetical protein
VRWLREQLGGEARRRAFDGARRGTVCSRVWKAAAFKACAEGVRRFAADRSELRLGMGVGWPWYGEAWAASCCGRGASGERRHHRPAREGEARGRSGETGRVRSAQWVPPRADRRALIGLGVRARGKTVAARRCVVCGVARDARTWARSAPNELRLAMFDCPKLKFLQHKWTK